MSGENRDDIKKQKIIKAIQHEMDMLSNSLSQLGAISLQFSEEIKNAKTKPKKDLYAKKLAKNNNLIADVLYKLDHNMKMLDLIQPTPPTDIIDGSPI